MEQERPPSRGSSVYSDDTVAHPNDVAVLDDLEWDGEFGDDGPIALEDIDIDYVNWDDEAIESDGDEDVEPDSTSDWPIPGSPVNDGPCDSGTPEPSYTPTPPHYDDDGPCDSTN